MSVLFDVPAGNGFYIKGPVQVRVTGWPQDPVIDIPANIVPTMTKDRDGADTTSRRHHAEKQQKIGQA